MPSTRPSSRRPPLQHPAQQVQRLHDPGAVRAEPVQQFGLQGELPRNIASTASAPAPVIVTMAARRSAGFGCRSMRPRFSILASVLLTPAREYRIRSASRRAISGSSACRSRTSTSSSDEVTGAASYSGSSAAA